MSLAVDLRVHRSERESESRGFLAEVGDLSFSELLFVLLRAEIVISDLVFEQMIDGARDLVGRSDQRLHRAELGFLASIEGAESALATNDAGGGLAKGLPGAVVSLQRVIAQDLAARDFVVWPKTRSRTMITDSHDSIHPAFLFFALESVS